MFVNVQMEVNSSALADETKPFMDKSSVLSSLHSSSCRASPLSPSSYLKRLFLLCGDEMRRLWLWQSLTFLCLLHFKPHRLPALSFLSWSSFFLNRCVSSEAPRTRHTKYIKTAARLFKTSAEDREEEMMMMMMISSLG